MTIEEMRKELHEYCQFHFCVSCLLHQRDGVCLVYAERYRDYSMSDDETKRYYATIHKYDTRPEPDAGQSAKADAGKLKITLVPRQIIWDIAAVRMYGNKKYPEGGPENWRQVEVERYKDALLRHLLAYLDDPLSVDEESGLPHRWHMECNMAFIAELEKELTNESRSKCPGDT